MRNGIVVADLTEASEVYGVHGSEGLSRWKCLARQAGLIGPWEAVEWAWIPVNGISGEHLHTRTEEVYFILSGCGLITLNGRPHPVQAGDLILTDVGTRHGLRNTGTEGLGWLVIEMASPATAKALRSTSLGNGTFPGNGAQPSARAHPGNRSSRMWNSPSSNATVIDLRTARHVDPSHWLTGPLRVIQLVTLRPGEQREVGADGAEHTIFTLHGAGMAIREDITVALEPEMAVTLPLETRITVVAGLTGLEYFQASLEVSADSRPGPHDDRPGGVR